MSASLIAPISNKRAGTVLGALLAIMLIGCSNLLTDLQEPNPPALRSVLADLVPPLSDVDFSVDWVTAALGLVPETINGTTVAWESSNPSVIAADGTIVRPLCRFRCRNGQHQG